MIVLLYIFIGLLAGSLSGFLGIGGGVILAPVFIFIFGMSRQMVGYYFSLSDASHRVAGSGMELLITVGGY